MNTQQVIEKGTEDSDFFGPEEFSEASENLPAQNQRQQHPASSKAAATPMELLSIAVSQGADTEKLEHLMRLQERWEANQARKAFMEAIAEFKSNPPTVVKDKLNKQYGSTYASIGNLVNTVNESLGKHKLHAHWEIDQKDKISVSCVLTHALGHSDKVTMSGPPDNSGQKNPIQQIRSTVTYLKIGTFEAVTGIASVDGNVDDDGNSTAPKKNNDIEFITNDQVGELMTMFTNSGYPIEKFCKIARINKLHELQSDRFEGAKKRLAQEIGRMQARSAQQ